MAVNSYGLDVHPKALVAHAEEILSTKKIITIADRLPLGDNELIPFLLYAKYLCPKDKSLVADSYEHFRDSYRMYYVSLEEFFGDIRFHIQECPCEWFFTDEQSELLEWFDYFELSDWFLQMKNAKLIYLEGIHYLFSTIKW